MAISKKTLTAAALTGILVLASGTAAAWCGGYHGNVQNSQLLLRPAHFQRPA